MATATLCGPPEKAGTLAERSMFSMQKLAPLLGGATCTARARPDGSKVTVAASARGPSCMAHPWAPDCARNSTERRAPSGSNRGRACA